MYDLLKGRAAASSPFENLRALSLSKRLRKKCLATKTVRAVRGRTCATQEITQQGLHWARSNSGTFSIQRSTPNAQRSSAFTLLEVLLAITITGFVLAAASTMLVSVTNIWASRMESNAFEDHVDGVTEFLQACFTNAGSEIALSNAEPSSGAEGGSGEAEIEDGAVVSDIRVGTGTDGRSSNGKNESAGESSGTGLLRTSDEPIGWAKPPGMASYRDPFINFKLKDTPPLLVNVDNAPIAGIDGFLHFEENEGLSLLWYSILQEEAEDENDLRRTLISPYVTQINYIYWDEQFMRWEKEDEPQEGENEEFLLPRFIKLTFEHEEITKERTVTIPVQSRSALIF